jgi:DNA polymerase I-like protein with 3'-5' exonuclease and polymerase domains
MPSLQTDENRKALENADFDLVKGPQQVALLKLRVAELAAHEGVLALDTETTGLDPHVNQVRLISVGTADYALLVDLDGWRTPGKRQVDWTQPGLRELKAVLAGRQDKVLQNAAFDLNFLRGEGVVLGGKIFDTMIAAKIFNNGSGNKNDLGAIVKRELRVELPKELQRADWGSALDEEMLRYAARDVICLPRLIAPLQAKLRGATIRPGFTLWEVFVLEMEALRPIATMQWHGFGFNAAGAAQLHADLMTRSEALKTAFLENLDECIKTEHPNDPLSWLPRNADNSFNNREKDSGSIRLGTKLLKGFNPRAPKQMAARFEQAGIMLPPDEKGAPSLDQNLLAFLKNDYPLIAQYLEWKNSVTRVSAIEKLLESVGPDGRIHAQYRQMGTETGRLSCSNPNAQQIPRTADFRSLFIAAAGYILVVADFSQVELRVAAQLSGEQRMIDAYLANRDLHTETAALMTGVPQDKVTKSARTSAKVANFGLLYGAGPATLQKQAVAQYGIDMSMEEASEIVQNFRVAYPRLYDWQREEGNRTTAAVTTKFGRRRQLVGFNDKYTTRINTQVQGTAGDIAKIAIVKLWKKICAAPVGQARLIAMVHDEIVLEVKEDQAEHWGQVLKHCMESAGSEICTDVPIVAEVSHGLTWADAK